MIYLDSSVVLAQLFLEERRPPDRFWHQAAVSSRLLENEVWNRIFARGFGQSLSGEVKAALRKIDMIDLTSRSLQRALQPFPIAIRTLDALHLATMDFLQANGEPVELAGCDARLLASARAGIGLVEL